MHSQSMQLAKLTRCRSAEVLEGRVETAQRIEPGVESDLEDTLVGGDEHPLDVLDAVIYQESIQCGAEGLLEERCGVVGM